MTKVIAARECITCGTKFVPKSKNNRFCNTDCRKGRNIVPPAPETAPEYTLTDPSNHLLATGPSALSCGLTETQEGEPCFVMTVRTQSTTCTVALTYKEASAWLAEFAYKVKDMQDQQEQAQAE
jgi:hypothetical protein